MAEIPIIFKKGKRTTDSPFAKPLERAFKEIAVEYKRIVIVPQDQKIIISKLRDEFLREKGVVVKKQAKELTPKEDEYRETVEKLQKLSEEIRELGKMHTREAQQLALKYTEIELKIVRAVPTPEGL